MDKPDIAVMMLLYNAEEDIRRSLDALVAQTYKNFHLFIVDDCSPDNTYAIVQEYKNIFPHMNVRKNQPNKGVLQNLLDALRLVENEAPQADFFIWACSDDWFSPTYLEITRNTLLRNPDAVICQAWYKDHDRKTEYKETHKMSSIASNSYS